MRFKTLTVIILVLIAASFSVADEKWSGALDNAENAYDQKSYKTCADYYKEAIKQGADKPGIYYDAACCEALAGNKDQAFKYLEKALEKGYTNADHLKNDKDLFSLHNEKKWLVIVSKSEKYLDKYLESVNAWVYGMFQADQRDRFSYKEGDDWGQIAFKDSLRGERIKNIYAKGDLKVSDDFYHAAMILHHSTDSSDYRLANQLAMKAVELDSTSDKARWLVAATTDRYLLKIGKPQIYGTQYNYKDGHWTLEPIDIKAATDKDREFFRVPSLSEAQRKINEMNSTRK